MNILVCISQVPDTTTKIQVSGDGQTIDKSGVKFILNPYDEFAIEILEIVGPVKELSVADSMFTEVIFCVIFKRMLYR